MYNVPLGKKWPKNITVAKLHHFLRAFPPRLSLACKTPSEKRNKRILNSDSLNWGALLKK